MSQDGLELGDDCGDDYGGCCVNGDGADCDGLNQVGCRQTMDLDQPVNLSHLRWPNPPVRFRPKTISRSSS